jgi:SagB-type dehydrogenase family enzyme
MKILRFIGSCVIVMNNISEDLLVEQRRKNDFANHLQAEVLSNSLLDQVVKMHQKGCWISEIMYEYEEELLEWMELVEFTDIIPEYYEKSFQFKIEQKTVERTRSCRTFKENWNINTDDFGIILRDSFGRFSNTLTKNYPSAGGLYPVLPLVYVFDEGVLKGISVKGCYLFHSSKNELILLKEYDEELLNLVINQINPSDRSLFSKIAIGYAIDLKRAITKYRKRGYRYALIEIGAMCQSFRETLSRFDSSLGEFCFAGFNDNALTHLSGLNARLAPVTLIQWFGERNDI